MIDVVITETIRDIDCKTWNDCFPGELENYETYRAIEESGIPGFSYGYARVLENGVCVAASAFFLTEYALDTTVQGYWKTLFGAFKQFVPWMMTLKLLCIGSPETENAHLGFHPSVEEPCKPEMLGRLLRETERFARSRGYWLLAVKDVPARQRALWEEVAVPRGFTPLASLPTAVLPIRFRSIDEYLASISHATRKDMRRKLRNASKVRVELKRDIHDVIGPIMEMYRDTKERSDWTFEDLTPTYFLETLHQMGDRALCPIYYLEDRPIGFNLLFLDQTRMIDKFFCMDSAVGRTVNLYFKSWFVNVGICIERGLSVYQSGQVGYANKLRLGSVLLPNWMYFKHRNPAIHMLLCWLSPILEVNQDAVALGKV
ncbi:MAG: GNAT family N-acetyltransferase [Candidatus Riflebacteria bacterium]|nr:GNAT family N-acetyltransferase [Candidatus Riflebacteria bacterium]